MNQKVLEKTLILNKKASSIFVGDESYIDKHPQFCVSHTSTSPYTVDIEILEVNTDGTKSNYIKLHYFKKQKSMSLNQLSLEAKSVGKLAVKELGCDTASFLIGPVKINTLSDGYYGLYLAEDKVNSIDDEFIIHLEIAADAMSHEDIVFTFKSLYL